MNVYRIAAVRFRQTDQFQKHKKRLGEILRRRRMCSTDVRPPRETIKSGPRVSPDKKKKKLIYTNK